MEFISKVKNKRKEKTKVNYLLYDIVYYSSSKRGGKNIEGY